MPERRSNLRFSCLLQTAYCLLLTAFCLLPTEITSQAAVISPEGRTAEVVWTEEEQGKEIAIKFLSSTEQASHHLVRLAGKEKPHIHRTHDGTVFMVKGRALIHFEDRMFSLIPGDVIVLPRGAVHWAENTGPEPAEAYVVFTPPFDGTDYIEV